MHSSCSLLPTFGCSCSDKCQTLTAHVTPIALPSLLPHNRKQVKQDYNNNMIPSSSMFNLNPIVTSSGHGLRARCTGLTAPSNTRPSANTYNTFFTKSIFKTFFAAVAAICLSADFAETSNLPPPVAAALVSNAANHSAAFALPIAYASTYATFFDPTSAYDADSFNNTSVNASDLTFLFAD